MQGQRVIAERYRLGRKLGEGGMGAVYQAEHVVTGRQFAVKLLEAQEKLPDEAVERFLREARAPAAIRHPNVVEVIDAGREPDGTPFIVMELLEGETLDDALKREGVVQPAVLAAVMDPLLAALDAMHARGFVHRDLKPANVFLARDESAPMRVKLLDFGIAKALGEDSRTKSGYVIGTPAYMAPEQMRNARNATPRSDLWSVGVILYECLAGHRPFRGETFGLLAAIAGPAPHVPLSSVAPAVPVELGALVDRLLSKNPADRPARAADVRAELLPLLARCPPVTPVPAPDDEPLPDDAPLPDFVDPRRDRATAAQRDRVSPDGPTAFGGLHTAPIPLAHVASEEAPVAPVPPPNRRVLLGVAAMSAAVLLVLAGLALRGRGHRHGSGVPTTALSAATPVSSNREVSDWMHRWLGTVAGSQGTAPVGAFYTDRVAFRGSASLASPAAIQRYWGTLFGEGGSFSVDLDRSQVVELPLDLNTASAACINLTGATGRMVRVRAWATEFVSHRSPEVGCQRLEGTYFVDLRRVGGALKICHETWSMREGICASCPSAPACQNGGAQRP